MKSHLVIILLSIAIFSCRSSQNRSSTMADQPASPVVPQVDYPPLGCEKFGSWYRPTNLENKISMGQDIDLKECLKALELSTPEWVCGKSGIIKGTVGNPTLYSRYSTTTGKALQAKVYPSLEDCAGDNP